MYSQWLFFKDILGLGPPMLLWIDPRVSGLHLLSPIVWIIFIIFLIFTLSPWYTQWVCTKLYTGSQRENSKGPDDRQRKGRGSPNLSTRIISRRLSWVRFLFSLKYEFEVLIVLSLRSLDREMVCCSSLIILSCWNDRKWVCQYLFDSLSMSPQNFCLKSLGI